MLFTVDPNCGRSLYTQIYDGIRKSILCGELRVGEKLPSKRRLAERLAVSVITVGNAYAQLTAEGYLTAVERRGHFVADVIPSFPRESAAAARKPEPEPAEKEYTVDFQSRNLSPEQFPFTVWARTMRSVLLMQDTRLLRPLEYNGVFELRSAIAGYLLRERGIHVSPGQITVGAGTEYLQHLLIQLLGRERVYGVEDPGYPQTGMIYESNGAGCRRIPLRGGGVSVDELIRQGVDVAHVTPSHHFPTGTVMPVSQRQALLRWAEEKDGRYIVEDDYDSEFRFVGRPIPTVFGTDSGGRVIYMNTFSKTIAPSIRISYMVLPEHLAEQFKHCLGFYSCTVSSFEQYTLAEFISRGHYERHLSRMKKLYRQKRDTVISAINGSALCGRGRILEEDAGLHFLVRLSTEVSDAELRRRAEDKGIRLSFLTDFLHRYSPESEHNLVISYSGINTEKLPQAFNEIAELI